ncbi:hypothetical protein [Priestia megaterium]|nr:hypothetical protein [Priestia megaterium]
MEKKWGVKKKGVAGKRRVEVKEKKFIKKVVLVVRGMSMKVE